MSTEPILRMTARVFADGVTDFASHSSPDNDWEREKRAMELVRGELDRILSQGPDKCPFAPGR